MNTLVRLENVRLSFPDLVEARVKTRTDEEGNKKIDEAYQASFLMPPDHPDFIKFKGVVENLAKSKLPDNWKDVLNVISKNQNSRCYGNGDERVNKKTCKVYDGYMGQVYISAKKIKRRGSKPRIIDHLGRTVPDEKYVEAATMFYPGCRVDVLLNVYWQNPGKDWGHGVRATLEAIRFRADDVEFVSAVDFDNKDFFPEISTNVPAAFAEIAS